MSNTPWMLIVVGSSTLVILIVSIVIAIALSSSHLNSASTDTNPHLNSIGTSPAVDIEELPTEWDFLSEVFSKYVNVFGVHIFATTDTPNSKVAHASHVLAQYLDNNADGMPDNPAVLNAMTQVNASIIMVAEENDMESIFRKAPERLHQMLDDGQLRAAVLYGEETNPHNRFDGSLEEVLHLISSVGYAQVYPDVFGEHTDSTIARHMDNARGGHFEEHRESDCYDDEPNKTWGSGQCALPPNGEYPEDAWYTYDDPTCNYSCMVTEYFYWGLTSLMGAQSDNQRCANISWEWTPCTAKLVNSMDPELYDLLTDPQYSLPLILPDGNYALPMP